MKTQRQTAVPAQGQTERQTAVPPESPRAMSAGVLKLSSTGGESIIEVMSAALVIALGALLLSSMLTAAMHMVRRSEKAYGQYVAEKNALATQGGVQEENDAYTFQTDDQAVVTIRGEGQSLSEAVTVYRAAEGSQTMSSYEAR